MLIKLNKKSFGEDLLCAFLTANTFKVSKTAKWKAERRTAEYFYDLAIRLGPRVLSEKVIAHHFTKTKRDLFSGELSWEETPGVSFTLEAVIFDQGYDSVEVSVHFVHNQADGSVSIATSPLDKGFADIAHQFEEMLQRLATALID